MLVHPKIFQHFSITCQKLLHVLSENKEENLFCVQVYVCVPVCLFMCE